MKILDLFSLYFLILMCIEGLMLMFVDAADYARANDKKSYTMARIFGITAIAASTVLFIIARIMA